MSSPRPDLAPASGPAATSDPAPTPAPAFAPAPLDIVTDPERFRSSRRDGQMNVVSNRRVLRDLSDVAHWMLTLSWMRFLSVLTAAFVASNAFFACLYLLGGDLIRGARPGNFWDAAAFSVQTMSTIGYGALTPANSVADALVAAEVFAGALGFALMTGLFFARFARPTARFLFSQVAVVRPRDGVPTLQFRLANERGNQIVDATMHVVMAYNHRTTEGEFMRSFVRIPLVRDRSPVFALSWTGMHSIDETSPLFGWDSERLAEVRGELVITVSGVDETFNQHVHSQHSYLWTEIFWDHRLVDVIELMPDGRRTINYARFHDVEPLV
jgi:inward rectifier potassium channel